jgi:segregation and condensation protein A
VPLTTALELEVFQGPLDLLLSLIERRQLEITEVSLAQVADQYLQAVRARPEPDAELLAEFLVIGARLLLLKSRALLPRPEPVEADEAFDDLAARLETYRQFRDRALEIAARLESGAQAFAHPPRPALTPFQPPLAPLDARELAKLWQAILRRQPPAAPRLEPPTRRVSVAERLADLRALLAARPRLDWDEVAGENLDEIIASFLAVLELVRRSELQVRQETLFGAITLLRLERAPEPRSSVE